MKQKTYSKTDKFTQHLEQKAYMKRIRSAKSALNLKNPVFDQRLEERQRREKKMKLSFSRPQTELISECMQFRPNRTSVRPVSQQREVNHKENRGPESQREKRLEMYKKELADWYISDVPIQEMEESPENLQEKSEHEDTPSEIRERQELEAIIQSELKRVEGALKEKNINEEEDGELCNYEVSSFIGKEFM